MAKREPGFVIPYGLLNALRKLSDHDVAQFVFAFGDYAKDGTEPEFDSVVLQILFESQRDGLQERQASYKGEGRQREFAGWCSGLKNANMEFMKIPYDDYCIAREQYEAHISKLKEGDPKPLFNDFLTQLREGYKEARTEEYGIGTPDCLL